MLKPHPRNACSIGVKESRAAGQRDTTLKRYTTKVLRTKCMTEVDGMLKTDMRAGPRGGKTDFSLPPDFVRIAAEAG